MIYSKDASPLRLRACGAPLRVLFFPGKNQVNWRNPAYLQHGNPRQQAAYRSLQSLAVPTRLARYTPVVCGTLPLAIDIAGSDVDVICEARDLTAFEQDVQAAFAACEGFARRREAVGGVPTIIGGFEFEGFPFEIFGQPRPVEEQSAYRHMVVEARLLDIGGGAARPAIRALKVSGLKTEPAFARYFGLGGEIRTKPCWICTRRATRPCGGQSRRRGHA